MITRSRANRPVGLVPVEHVAVPPAATPEDHVSSAQLEEAIDLQKQLEAICKASEGRLDRETNNPSDPNAPEVKQDNDTSPQEHAPVPKERSAIKRDIILSSDHDLLPKEPRQEDELSPLPLPITQQLQGEQDSAHPQSASQEDQESHHPILLRMPLSLKRIPFLVKKSAIKILTLHYLSPNNRRIHQNSAPLTLYTSPKNYSLLMKSREQTREKEVTLRKY